MTTRVLRYGTRDEVAAVLASLVAAGVRDALALRPRASLCLPGGTTPGPMLKHLADADLAWSRVDVLPGDERCVPVDHPRSNLRLLREMLGAGPAKAATLLPLYNGDVPEAAAQAARPSVAQLAPLDVTVLGMGADMHTASLFPGADGLDEALSADAPAVLAIKGGGATEPRLTLAAHVLSGSRHKHLLIFGDEKLAAFHAARDLSPTRAPISAMQNDLIVHWAL